ELYTLSLHDALPIFSQLLSAQGEQVRWSTSVEKMSDTEYELVMRASIIPNWHLYTTQIPDGGPIPTSFTFEGAGEDFKLEGDIRSEEYTSELQSREK